MMKGQLEFIVVLGIIVVVVVVGMFALQNGAINTQPVTPDTKLVQDSTANFIRNAVYDTLRTVSDNGGYLEPQASSVAFMTRSVPYWMKGGQITVPDVRANIVNGITSYIASNKGSFSKSIRGKNVTLGAPQTTVNILDNQITVTVNMPTTVNGVGVPQPYVVSVPTKIGEVVEFSKNFATSEAQNRYLETFVISSMVITPYDGDVQTVPMFVHLVGCGKMALKGWWDVKPALEEVIRVTLGRTYMPDKYPMGEISTNPSPKYGIPELGGKKNLDINVSFDVADDFGLNANNFQMDPSVISVIAEPIPMVGRCVSDALLVKYYIKFPAVVKVTDPVTGNTFKFAVEVLIKDNAASPWAVSGGYETSAQGEICSEKSCSITIKAVDTSGKPVDGAGITFMGCGLGTTGSDGSLTAKTACGFGPIEAYKSGYGQAFKDGVSSGSTETITLESMPRINLHFYEVLIDNPSSNFMQNGSMYSIPTRGIYADIGNEELTGVNALGSVHTEVAQLSLYRRGQGKFYDRFFTTSVGALAGVPEGNYSVGGVLIKTDPATGVWSGIYGGFGTNFTITKDMDGKDIYIYLPYSYSFSQASNDTQMIAGLVFSSMLSKCGFGPISTSGPDANLLPCTKSISDL
jgi:hypothetical protein